MSSDQSELPWEVCSESGCIGTRYKRDSTCVQHGPPRALHAALDALREGDALDWTRGLTIDSHLMDEIRGALPVGSDGQHILPEVRFDNATFTTAAKFASCTFRGNAHFGSCKFAKGAEFGGAHFLSGYSFRDADFHGRAFFKAAESHGLGGFQNATFNGIAAFSAASMDSADFSGSHFAQRSRLQFDAAKVITLDECVFEGAVDIDCNVFETFSAKGAKLLTEPRQWTVKCLGSATLEAIFFDAPFTAEIQARQIIATGIRTTSRGRIAFLGDLDASDLDAGAELLMEPIAADLDKGFQPERFPPRLVSLQRAVLDKVSVSDVDVRPCLFAGAHRLDQLRLEGARFAQPPTGWKRHHRIPIRWTRRQTIAEEHVWRKANGYSQDWSPDVTQPASAGPRYSELSAEHIAALYRALRKGREDSKDIPGGGDFYYGEMEMRRHARIKNQPDLNSDTVPRQTSLAERQILSAYWLISGYGLRASRAALWLFAALLLISMGLDSHGFEPDRNYSQSLLFAAENSISFLRPPLTQDLTCAGTVMQIALRLMGPLLLGLAILALRARVKR